MTDKLNRKILQSVANNGTGISDVLVLMFHIEVNEDNLSLLMPNTINPTPYMNWISELVFVSE